MGKKRKKLSFWIKRRSQIPFLAVAAIIIAALFFNEDTSMQLNMEYEQQIEQLQAEIRQNRDSASYYRRSRQAVMAGKSDLEHLAREQYHMQRPTEDVFILK